MKIGTVRFSLRKKIVLISLAVSIVIALSIGISIFLQAYSLFFENFARDKHSLARTIGLVLDGDDLARFTSPEALFDPVYQDYQQYLHKIKENNPDISYLYSIIYDPAQGCHLYTLDGNTNKQNTLWVESDAFALICRIGDSGAIEVEYEQDVYTEDFNFKEGKKTYSVSFQHENNRSGIAVNSQPLFSLINLDPLSLETPGGVLLKNEAMDQLRNEGKISVLGAEETVYYTLSLKGLPESIPGEPFNKKDRESIDEFMRIIDEDEDYISEKFEKTDFGDTLFIYSILESSQGGPPSILCLEIWAREAEQYRRSVMIVTIIVTGIAFVLSIVIYLVVIDQLVVKAIKELSGGIGEISRGNLDFHVQIARNDEIGQLADAFNQMADDLKEKELVKELFGKYVQKEVADAAIRDGLVLGGKKQTAAVLFSDIRGFTTLSEQYTPEELVTLLNRYFSLMVEQIARYNGVLDKYIGDAVMVHFGILGGMEYPSDKAVQAAIGMTRGLAAFNKEQLQRGEPELKAGIGIHTGDLVAGNIGAPNRMEFTVIGDSVNLASRVEGITKLFGAKIIITESTFNELKNQKAYSIRPLERVIAKGKSTPVFLYEVCDGDDAALRDKKMIIQQDMEEAARLYRARKFREAEKLYSQCLEVNPQDRLIRYFIEKCDEYSLKPPDPAWDGSLSLTTK